MKMTRAQQVEVLRASCCIAGVDGNTSQDEMSILKEMAGNLGVGRASLEAMISRAETDKEFYKQQFNILNEFPLECLDFLIRVLVANGEVKAGEFDVLKGLATSLNISHDEFSQRVTHAVQDLGHPTGDE